VDILQGSAGDIQLDFVVDILQGSAGDIQLDFVVDSQLCTAAGRQLGTALAVQDKPLVLLNTTNQQLNSQSVC